LTTSRPGKRGVKQKKREEKGTVGLKKGEVQRKKTTVSRRKKMPNIKPEP